MRQITKLLLALLTPYLQVVTNSATAPITATAIPVNTNQVADTTSISALSKDSVLVVKKVELIKVPLAPNFNVDSFITAQNKVVLEWDTMHMGLKYALTKTSHDSVAAKIPFSTTSMFKNHLLKPTHNEPLIREAQTQNWVTLVLFSVFLLIALLRTYYQKRFTLVINSFFNNRFSNQIIRDENALTQRTSVILSVVFFLSMGLFFYQASSYFRLSLGNFNSFQTYLLIILICVLFYAFKIVSNKVGGYLFKVSKETDQFILNQFIGWQVLGLIMAILALLISYTSIINREYLIYSGIIILLGGFLVRLVRSFGIAKANVLSPIYIFLYLCTLEIIPVLIIAKVLM